MLHTISRNFQFRTVECFLHKQKASMEDTREGLRRTLPIYTSRGLQVSQVNGDKEFENMEDVVRPANLHIVAANEHIGDVKRSIRTIKECTRAHVHRLPYKRYPKLMVAGMVLHVVKNLNSLPTDIGIQCGYSPASLITGSAPVDYNTVISLNFGDYVQVHEEKYITND